MKFVFSLCFVLTIALTSCEDDDVSSLPVPNVEDRQIVIDLNEKSIDGVAMKMEFFDGKSVHVNAWQYNSVQVVLTDSASKAFLEKYRDQIAPSDIRIFGSSERIILFKGYIQKHMPLYLNMQRAGTFRTITLNIQTLQGQTGIAKTIDDVPLYGRINGDYTQEYPEIMNAEF